MGSSGINAAEYVPFRLHPTLERFNKLAAYLERRSTILQMLIFFATTMSALLGLVSLTSWMPVTVSFGASATAIMDYHMYVARLASVNTAILSLENVLIWWESLSIVERK